VKAIVKKDPYSSRICKPFCAFYREGRETLLCGSYRYLMESCSIGELSEVPPVLKPDFSEDEWIGENICRNCEFISDGCDYRLGNPSPPCGGYAVVEWLRKRT
jgi:hypothetical protein